MSLIPTEPKSTYPNIYLEDSDVELPRNLDNKLRYVYFKVIARGGTCTISSCQDRYLRRTVAYKALNQDLQDKKVEQKRLIREARITAMLQHPNTVPTYELGRDSSGHVYFTMKLVQGQTMRDLIDTCIRHDSHESGQHNLASLVSIMAQVGHSLHYAHNHGVLHRDIKPENVLVGSYGEVLLLDWGMAKVWSKTPSTDNEPEVKKHSVPRADPSLKDELVTHAHSLRGTPAYLSPEQLAREADLGHRSDIYSFGAILYEVLTLQRLVPGDTVVDVLDHIRKGDSPQASIDRSNQLMTTVFDVVQSCIERDPTNRPKSLDSVIAALDQALLR